MASLSINEITDSTWYIPGPVNIGICIEDDGAVVIDSGNDKEAGRQICKLLRERNLEIKGICNTHSNADHIGGNDFIKKKTGCWTAAAPLESAFITEPLLETSLLWGGYPFPEIQNKFMKAKSSSVEYLIPEEGPVPNTCLKAFHLPGHFIQMVGFRTVDDIIFLADSLFSEEILRKYHLVYIYDIEAFYGTIERLLGFQGALFIPSHSKPAEDIRGLAEKNKRKVDEIALLIEEFCSSALPWEEVLRRVCGHYGITLDYNQYVLLGSTVRSYLAFLGKKGTVKPILKDNTLLWHRQ